MCGWRANPGDVDRLLLNTATQDGKQVRIGQDPGQAGKSQALHLVRAFSGFTVAPTPPATCPSELAQPSVDVTLTPRMVKSTSARWPLGL